MEQMYDFLLHNATLKYFLNSYDKCMHYYVKTLIFDMYDLQIYFFEIKEDKK